MGGFDIFISTGEKSAWSKPLNLKYPVNSTRDDFYFVSKDSLLTGYLSSDREGGLGSDDIYSFTYPARPAAIGPEEPHLSHKPLALMPPANRDTGRLSKPVTIYYNLDKAVIRSDATAELNGLVQLLKASPALRVEVASYTDSRASSAYNLALSARRSASAVAYLVARGLDSRRFSITNYGEQNPAAPCGNGVPCTEADHQLNRRTVLTLQPPQAENGIK